MKTDYILIGLLVVLAALATWTAIPHLGEDTVKIHVEWGTK